MRAFDHPLTHLHSYLAILQCYNEHVGLKCYVQHFMRKLAAVIIIGMKHNLEQTLKYHRLYVPKNITTPLTKIYA